MEELVVLAGPSASGKKTLAKGIQDGIRDLEQRLYVGDLRQWTLVSPRWLQQTTSERAILQYDFLWSYPGSNLSMIDDQTTLSSVLKAVKNVSIVTLWTPPERLARQLIDGKLRRALQDNSAQFLKARMFRLLPRGATLALCQMPGLDRMNRALPGHATLHHLLALAIYARAGEIVARYRRWFDFCDRETALIRRHLIVEYDKELHFLTRSEWAARVKSIEEADIS